MKTNFDIAKEEADSVDQKIIEALEQGKNFLVEAGAGSGKTYSLNKVIEWIQSNKWLEYSRRKQSVACITFTNAAVDVIRERLPQDTFICPSTIHAFAWNAIKQFQAFLIRYILNETEFQKFEIDSSTIKEVTYTLGIPYEEDGIFYLGHNHILTLFQALLDSPKFRRIFEDKYPLILIDEYQDTNKLIIYKFIEHFISQKTGPQFGFFGDAWQTIYGDGCGFIEDENLTVIKKGSNFRSAPKIVELLNQLRPDLPQTSAIDNFKGEVIAITCEDYKGVREMNRPFQGDLPTSEFKARINNIKSKINNEYPKTETLKILMITHKTLAKQQGYEQLFNILSDTLKSKEDPFLLFFMEMIEPVFQALKYSEMQLLFETLGVKRIPIEKKSEKIQWRKLLIDLENAREKRAIDVLEVSIKSNLIPIPQKVEEWYEVYLKNPDSLYTKTESIQTLLDLEYKQFISAIDFLSPNSLFSTEHGVKGEEYDNIVFVISKGWSNYKFEDYAPMITGISNIPTGKQAAYERNRNLFYVCCSRPKKRLIFFISVPIDKKFEQFLEQVVGKNNIYTYTQYIETPLNKKI